MLQKLEHHGRLIGECPLPGEGFDNDVFPSHPNGIQVAEDRFLVIYATRGYRGVDDNLSVCYQLRDGDYDGNILAEGFLTRSTDDWDPFFDGHRYVRQHGHPVAFGVPAGARINGSVPAHAGLFAVKWRIVARRLREDEPHLMVDIDEHHDLTARTQGCEWMQIRLRADRSDVDVVEPPKALRQEGYEAGAYLCQRDVRTMNQSYTQPVPYTADGTEWADVNHFDQHGYFGVPPTVAPLRYKYDPSRDRFRWVETGPLIDAGLFEASLVAPRSLGASGADGNWIIESRTKEGGQRAGHWRPGGEPDFGGPVGWATLTDLFADTPEVIKPSEPRNNAPITAFRCADGEVRLLSGDPVASPYHNPRNPLYIWDIDPDAGFVPSRRELVLDIVAAGIPIPEDDLPKCEMAKVLPHAGGTSQVVLHGIYPRSVNQPYLTGRVADSEGKKHTGIYYARLHYDRDIPGVWQF